MASIAGSPVAMSLIVPTRERAHYLRHSLRTCLATPVENVEVIVLDNVSVDDTREVVAEFIDPRLRYIRSERRLSMRQNFERGLDEARGEIICFIGDDDAVLPSAIPLVLDHMRDPQIAAVSNTRAHYGWPDLGGSRRDTALVPRSSGCRILESRAELRRVLSDVNYYRLPCVYHGFVRHDLVRRVKQRQQGFFKSSQVDMYSAIALSMENVRYVHSATPLIVNGGSKRSNGASYAGQTSGEERAMWMQEDDVNFLPGFEDPITVGSAVLESALRYGALADTALLDIFDRDLVVQAAASEYAARRAAGRPIAPSQIMLAALGIEEQELSAINLKRSRALKMINSFIAMRPIDTAAGGIVDVEQASRLIDEVLAKGKAGFFDQPMRQVAAALRFAR